MYLKLKGSRETILLFLLGEHHLKGLKIFKVLKVLKKGGRSRLLRLCLQSLRPMEVKDNAGSHEVDGGKNPQIRI